MPETFIIQIEMLISTLRGEAEATTTAATIATESLIAVFKRARESLKKSMIMPTIKE